jgi:serine/threonine protein kinase
LKTLVGEGSFSKVYLGVRYKDKEERAIKVIKKEKISKSVKGRKALMKEIEIMRKVNHPRIVKLYEVYENDISIFLVLEYLKGGELLQFMRNKGLLTEKDASMVIKSTLEALEYCHRLKIVHRDLKPENLILT